MLENARAALLRSMLYIGTAGAMLFSPLMPANAATARGIAPARSHLATLMQAVPGEGIGWGADGVQIEAATAGQFRLEDSLFVDREGHAVPPGKVPLVIGGEPQSLADLERNSGLGATPVF